MPTSGREPAGGPLEIGTETQWGPISAVGVLSGERYYWMIDRHGAVSMMPADVVEGATGGKGER